MERYFHNSPLHPCGTPGCALGNYVARKDLQTLLTLKWHTTTVPFVALVETGKSTSYDSHLVLDHFGIICCEAEELFSYAGCGGAKTAIQAAEYIEKFVAEHPRYTEQCGSCQYNNEYEARDEDEEGEGDA